MFLSHRKYVFFGKSLYSLLTEIWISVALTETDFGRLLPRAQMTEGSFDQRLIWPKAHLTEAQMTGAQMEKTQLIGHRLKQLLVANCQGISTSGKKHLLGRGSSGGSRQEPRLNPGRSVKLVAQYMILLAGAPSNNWSERTWRWSPTRRKAVITFCLSTLDSKGWRRWLWAHWLQSCALVRR